MLLRQNLRRRHEGSLIARFDCEQDGRDRDDRFSRTNVALQQTIHWELRFHVASDLVDDFFLRGRQSKRKRANKFIH